MIEHTQPPEKRTALHGAAQGNTEKNKEFVMDMKKDNVELALGHRAPFWRQLTATIVIVAFGGLVTAPAVAATRAELDRLQRVAPGPSTPAASFNITLREIREQLKTLAMADDMKGAIAGANQETARVQLRALHDTFKDQHRAALEDFAGIEAHLKAHGFGEEILQRHHEAVKHYQAEAEALLRDLAGFDGLEGARATEHAARAYQRLNDQPLEKSHKPFDPSRLPFGSPEPVVIRPADSLEEFQLRKGGSTVATLSEAEVNDPTNPAYLAETPEVVITAAIRSLAEELERNPVKIRNWVRNNIEYLPTWGSLQGAQLTLDNRKGNAFDIASLTIALLRASEIPARYVQGTVELPVDQALNWLGGLENPHAASNLLGQGGVPNMLIVSGGQPTHLRMEHVWVEAWVDFYPSRGAINSEGDSWVPMDTSFKQYAYSEGMDLQQEVPFDAEGFANEIMEATVINEQEGWVQGVDQALIQQRMNDYRIQVETFIDTQAPETTVGEILGGRTILQEDVPVLADSLPARHIATFAYYAELPATVRFHFRYELRDQYGSVLAGMERATVALAGKRLAVSFRPASQADIDLIASYLPEVPEGGEIDPSDLPSTLPGYLIRLVTEFTVDGDVVASGPTVTMGTELQGQLGYRYPNKGWDLRPKQLIAGEYQAIGLDLAGIAQSQLVGIKTELEQAQAQLQEHNPEGLTRHSLTGNLLQTGVLSYFALNDVQDKLAGMEAGVVTYRLPSFGTFATTVSTHYWWGIPRDVSFPGVTMDIDYLYSQTVDKLNSQENVVNFGRATGPRMSALEHLVPEQLFSTEDNPAEGISAVKAIAIAQAEGQRVYTLNPNNLNAALAAINASPDIEAEIRNAVLNGQQATIHQDPINHYGWSGHGYIIFDPATGSGAYKIGGGADGGFLKYLDNAFAKGMLWLSVIYAYLDKIGAVDMLGFLGDLLALGEEALDTFEKCKYSINVFWIFTIFMFMVVATLFLAFALIGVGFFLSLVISLIAEYLRQLALNHLTSEYC